MTLACFIFELEVLNSLLISLTHFMTSLTRRRKLCQKITKVEEWSNEKPRSARMPVCASSVPSVPLQHETEVDYRMTSVRARLPLFSHKVFLHHRKVKGTPNLSETWSLFSLSEEPGGRCQKTAVALGQAPNLSRYLLYVVLISTCSHHVVVMLA